jgi:hypothetical protein
VSVYVFTGPSLSAEQSRELLEAVYLPPVSQGDVYRVALKRPQAIGIIDGYFERVPSVWHKEIMWAMKEGIHVFGSASMGALRAVELEAFGMEGVGAVYEAFRSGELEDDDEVAVVHGPAETGYRSVSEAMVNIRFTLARAQDAGVVTAPTRAALVRMGKDLFYPDRSYPEILRLGRQRGLPAAELDALQDWLPSGQVNQKRDDARAMLETMRDRLAAGLPPKRVSYTVEHTTIWHAATALPGTQGSGDDASALLPNTLREEMQVEGSFTRIQHGALVRFLATQEASRQSIVLTGEQLQRTGDRWRDRRELKDIAAFQQWLDRCDLTLDTFSVKLRDEALLQLVRSWAGPDIEGRLIDELLMTGEYERLVARALDKERVLESRGQLNPRWEDVDLTQEELLRWYFEQRLGRAVPRDVFVYARENGFEDDLSLRRAILREYCYCGSPVRDAARTA